MIFAVIKALRPRVSNKWTTRLKFAQNDRTDTNFMAMLKINLQSYKSIPERLKQRFKAVFERKPTLGAPVV